MKTETIKYFRDSIIYQRQILDDLKTRGKRTAYKEHKAYYDGMLDMIRAIATDELPTGENTIAGLLEKYGYTL